MTGKGILFFVLALICGGLGIADLFVVDPIPFLDEIGFIAGGVFLFTKSMKSFLQRPEIASEIIKKTNK